MTAAMDSKQSHKVWEMYGQFLDEALSHGQNRRFDIWAKPYAEFLESSVATGRIPDTLAASLIDALSRCSVEAFRNDSAHPQFDRSELPQAMIEHMNVGNDYYRLSVEALWHLANILELLRDDLASILGSPWRVLGVRGWSLTTQSTDVGPNEFHLDGLPPLISKVMIYPTPINKENGTLQLRLPDESEVTLEFDSPTWILFKPSDLLHRGLPPQAPNFKRYAVEATVIPSVAFGVTPFFAGNNARHPYFPWYRACYHGL